MDPVPSGPPRLRLGDLYPVTPSDTPRDQPASTSASVSPEIEIPRFNESIDRRQHHRRDSRRRDRSEGLGAREEGGRRVSEREWPRRERESNRRSRAGESTEPEKDDVRLSGLDMALNSSSFSNARVPQESLAARTVSITAAMGKNLRILGWAFIWIVAVRIVMAVCFYTGVISSDYAVSKDTRINDALIGTSTSASCLLNLTASFLAFLAAYQCDLVAEAAHGMGEAIELVVLILAAVFNTFTISVILRTALDTVTAVIVHNDMLAVIGGSMLLFALFWVSGFVVLQLWYARTELLHTYHFAEIMNAHVDELEEVPLFIRFWMRMIFGRLRPQKEHEEARSWRPAALKSAASMISEEHAAILPEQIHILHILTEALIKSQKWICVKIYTAIVLMWTYGNSGLWPQLAAELIDVAKYLIVFGMIYKGTGSFQRLLVSCGSDVENLLRALQELNALFARLWFMFIASSTLTLGVALGFSTRS